MKLRRWISLMLIVLLTVTLVTGCAKTPQEEEGASTDEWVDIVESEKDDSNINSKPSSGKNNNTNDDNTAGNNDNDNTGNGNSNTGNENNTSGNDDDTGNGNSNTGNENNTSGNDDDTNDNDPSGDDDDTPAEWVPVQKESSGMPITFMMQNVFHGGSSPDYSVSTTNQKALGNRLARFKSMIQANDPDVIFVQEARPGQIGFYTEDPYLSQVYDIMYQYRAPHMPDQGGEQSEPVLWKSSKYKCLDKGNFWLSDTPDRFSTSWNSSSTTGHNCNWAKLQAKDTGIVFYVYCVHIDPYGSECQYESMQLYYKKAAQAKDDEYVFFGGDYNCKYRTDDAGGGNSYNRMMADWSKVCDFRDAAMYLYKDGLCQLGGMASSKNVGYDTKALPEVTTGDTQIDYLMGKPMPNMCIDYYGFDYTVYDNQAMGVPKGHISDHWGLVVKMRLGTNADYSQYYREQYEYENDQYYFNATLKD